MSTTTCAAALGALGRERGPCSVGQQQGEQAGMLSAPRCVPPEPDVYQMCAWLCHQFPADTWALGRQCQVSLGRIKVLCIKRWATSGSDSQIPVVITLFETPWLACSLRTASRHCCAGIKEAQGHIQLLVQEDTSSWAAAVWGDNSQP